MHRKYVKGKSNDKKHLHTAPEKKMVQSESPQVPEFLSRVANIPVVHSALGYASDAYIKAKDYSPPLIKKTWDTAEDTVNYAASFALPVMHTLERPIHAVDTLACKTLDKVEETLPVVTKTPEEIMNNTRTYVNDKLQPVQNGVTSAVHTVSVVTNLLLSNPLGRLALNTMEFSMATVHEAIDYIIPPGANESAKDCPAVPVEPSLKIMWAVRRSFDAAIKVQYRLTSQARQVLHLIALRGLVAAGALIDLLEWVQLNWQDMMIVGLPAKLHQLANYYRDSADGDRKEPPNVLQDVMFLATHFTKSCIDAIRGAISVVTSLPASQPVMALRLQLSIALAVSLDFLTRVLSTLTSGNLMVKSEEFLKTDFPLVHKALMTAKNLAVGTMKEKKKEE